MNAKLVGGQSTSLICAQNVYTRQTLDGSQLLHDGLSPSKERGTDSHRCGCNARQADRDTNNL
jgi:hypothetical protein